MPRDPDASVDGDESSEFGAVLRAVAAAPELARLPNAPPLMPGVEVGGSFRVESKLGEGAMGVVYLANDLALDRPVALKLRSAASEAVGSRMWREAKAMARLSHPNVLTVYEVGVFEGRVFIAMELVDGGTLRDWLQTRRPWQEIVSVFAQAARGLAAAHDVDLVHRDFKPTNVLIGKDGRVRVADFGLARSMDGDPDSTAGSDSVPSEERSPCADELVTATGTLVGTPFYMAPELRDGAPATPRADQYSFWLSLDGALRGPRGGPKPEGDVERGALGTVPKHIRAAVTRGLSTNPAQRFEDMRAVIDVLTAGTPRGRRVAWVSAGVIGVGAAGFGANAWSETRATASCRERADAIDQVLGATSRASLDAAFRETKLPYASNVVLRMEPQLDAYSEGWRSAYAQTCIATEVEQAQPAKRWSATQACLHERKETASLWVAAMADGPDEGVVRDAVTAVGRLGSLSVCTDAAWLARHPAGAGAGDRESRTRLRRAGALFAAGQHKPAMDLVAPLLDEEDEALRAEALVLGGEVGLELGDAEVATKRLRTGYSLALAHSMDDLALEASTELVYATGSELRLFDEAHWWARTARGFLQRLDQQGSRHAGALHSNVGIVYEAQDRASDALPEHRRALELYEAHLPEGHPELAFAHNNIGTTLLSLQEFEAATTELEQATQLLEQVFGLDHPSVGLGFSNLGILYKRQRKLADAQRAQRRAVAVFSAGSGPDHPRMAMLRANLGATLVEAGLLDEAEKELREALRVSRATEGSEGRSAGLTHHHLGNLFLAQERYEDALRAHQTALKISVANDGAENPRAATSYFNVGRARLGAGQRAGARTAFERAVEINLATRGPEHPQTAITQLALGKLELQDNPAAALPLLTAARRTLASRPPNDPDRLSAEAALTQAQRVGP